MIKKNIKRISIFLYALFFFSNSLAFDDSDIFLESVFFTAVKKSDYDKVIEMFEKGVSSNLIDSEKMSPLAYSLANDDEKMFNLLLKNDADISRNILNKTSLLTFYIKSQKSKLLKLIILNGADVNSQDRIGMTPMMHAIENLNVDAIKLLSNSKIVEDLQINISDYSGKTIFDYANDSRDSYVKELIDSLKKTF